MQLTFSRMLWLLLCAPLLLLACNQSANEQQTPTVDIPTAAPTAVSANDAIAAETPVSGETAFVLGVWLPPRVSIQADQSGSSVMQQLLQAYEATHPDVDIDVQVKGVTEQGGILNYLRTGRSVAPGALPDVIALPSEQLQVATAEELIVPLDGLFDVEPLYPAARALGEIDGRLMGYPFAVDQLHHLVYNGNVISGTLPQRWDDLVALERGRLSIAGSGDQGAALALQLYADQGGSLADGTEGFIFQAAPLTVALAQLENARSSDLILADAITAVTADNAWELFQRGDATVVFVDAVELIERRRSGNSSRFGPIPGSDGATQPLVRGWVWAITTTDPARQALSVELINWLTAAQNLGDYTAAADLLPTLPAAWERWPRNDPYIAFLQDQLALARALPASYDSTDADLLANGVISLLNQRLPADQAAEQVIEAMLPR